MESGEAATAQQPSPRVTLDRPPAGTRAGAQPAATPEAPHATITDVLAAMQRNAWQISQVEEQLQELLERQQALMQPAAQREQQQRGAPPATTVRNAHATWLLQAERVLEQDRVVAALGQRLGVSKGRPVAAVLIYRCCQQWSSWVSSAAPELGRIAAALQQQLAPLEAHHPADGADAIVLAAYALAVAAAVLHLAAAAAAPPGRPGATAHGASASSVAAEIRRAATDATSAVQRKLAGTHLGSLADNIGHLWGRRQHAGDAHASGGSPVAGAAAAPAAPSAPAPLAAFCAALDALVVAAFTGLRDQAKRSLAPVLANCMLHPGLAAPEGGAHTLGSDEGGTPPRRALASSASVSSDEQLEVFKGWCDIVGQLHGWLQTMAAAAVPPPLRRALMEKLAAFINAQLFNQLLLRPECCSVANARYGLVGLKRLDAWLVEAGPGELGGAWDALAHVRQALQFLVLHNKGALGYRTLREDVCPALTPQQLYRLATTMWDPEPSGAGASVPGDVLEELQAAEGVTTQGNGLIVTYLLEEDASLPFVSHGACSPSAVAAWGAGRDWDAPLEDLPAALHGAECPPAVWEFLVADVRASVPR